MARETWVQSQVESDQRLKKWYLMPTCLTLSIIRHGSRVKWSNPGKGVAPSPTPWCCSYRKRNLRVTLDNGRQLYLLTDILRWLFNLKKYPPKLEVTLYVQYKMETLNSVVYGTLVEYVMIDNRLTSLGSNINTFN